MQQNPIRRVRDELGVTNFELAEMLGIGRTTLMHIMAGYPRSLSYRVQQALDRIGYDGAALAREYAEWRSKHAAQVAERAMNDARETREEDAPTSEPVIVEEKRPPKPSFKRLRNMTLHPIYIYVDGLEAPITIPPDSEGPARVMVRHVPVTNVAGVPIWRTEPVSIVGLPDPEPDTAYIVSKVVADALRGKRHDLLVPDVLIRDEEGRIKGARGLSWVV